MNYLDLELCANWIEPQKRWKGTRGKQAAFIILTKFSINEINKQLVEKFAKTEESKIPSP